MWFVLQMTSIGFWSLVNVLDSILVKNYQKHPMVLGWNQSCFSLIFLSLLWLIGHPGTEWIVPLLVVGAIAFLGDIVFWRTLALIDVSIANLAWPILSFFLAIGGFFLFHEEWSLQHTAGAFLMMIGVVFLSVWHRKVDRFMPLLLLPLLAFLYVPFYLTQEAALLNGISAFHAFFWIILGRESMFFFTGLIVPNFRRRIIDYIPRSSFSFYALNGLVVFLFFSASFLTTQAFSHGPVSLIAMLGNTQPFIVLLLAWVFIRLFPRYTPRELLSVQSVQVKIISFTIVFGGLALLALSP